jgi:hypothetical protein
MTPRKFNVEIFSEKLWPFQFSFRKGNFNDHLELKTV